MINKEKVVQFIKEKKKPIIIMGALLFIWIMTMIFIRNDDDRMLRMYKIRTDFKVYYTPNAPTMITNGLMFPNELGQTVKIYAPYSITSPKFGKFTVPPVKIETPVVVPKPVDIDTFSIKNSGEIRDSIVK
jgi:hypothetical protein